MSVMTVEEWNVVQAMKREGGSFVHSIAEAFMHADRSNFDKLKAAFPEYWQEYEQIAVLRPAKRHES